MPTHEPASPLAAIMGLAGAGLSGNPPSLLATAEQLDALHRTTGYESLKTFAQACREMHNELTNEQETE